MSELGRPSDEKRIVRRTRLARVARQAHVAPAQSTGPVFGRLAGQIRIAADFDQTPACLIDAMEGNS